MSPPVEHAAPPSRSPPGDSRAARLRFAVLIASAIYIIGLLAVAAYRVREDQSSTSDFDDFWLTARYFLSTGEWTDRFGVHNYLPFFAFFTLPLAWLPLKPASIVFNLLGFSGFFWCVRAMDEWTRPPLGVCSPGDHGQRPHTAAPLILAVIMVLPYATDCVALGQMALLTLTMLLFACRALERGRDARGAFWLALAISTKVYPAIFLPWLLLKRRWRAVAWIVVWLLVMNAAVPSILFGPDRAWQLHKSYWTTGVVGNSSLRLLIADSNKQKYSNQSLAVVLRRILLPTPPDDEVYFQDPPLQLSRPWRETTWSLGPVHIGPLHIRAVQLAPIQWVLIAIQGGLLLSALIAARRPARSLQPAHLRREFAIFMLLGLLLSPILWTFYFVGVFPALALISERTLRNSQSAVTPSDSRTTRVFAYLTCILWLAAIPALASATLRFLGFHYFATLVLFVTTLLAAARHEPIVVPASRSAESRA